VSGKENTMNAKRGSFTVSAGLALGTLLALGSMSALAKDTEEYDSEEITRAKNTLDTFKTTDASLKTHLSDAVGYAVFPQVGKGGLVIGAASGKGVLFEKGVATGITRITQVTVGAQAGGQSYSELIIFKSAEALNDFKRGQFAMSSDASAVAGAAGAAENLQYTRGVAVMTMAKGGLMAEASIGGQKFSYKPFEKTVPKM
jgi:lipid-binding SYLF domain-containing protein